MAICGVVRRGVAVNWRGVAPRGVVRSLALWGAPPGVPIELGVGAKEALVCSVVTCSAVGPSVDIHVVAPCPVSTCAVAQGVHTNTYRKC